MDASQGEQVKSSLLAFREYVPLSGFSEDSRKYYTYDPVKETFIRIVPRDVDRNFKNVAISGFTIDELMAEEFSNEAQQYSPHIRLTTPESNITKPPLSSTMLSESDLDREHPSDISPSRFRQRKNKAPLKIELKAKTEAKRRLRRAKKAKVYKSPLERKRSKESRAKSKLRHHRAKDRHTKYDSQGRFEDATFYDGHYRDPRTNVDDDPYECLDMQSDNSGDSSYISDESLESDGSIDDIW